MLTRIFTRVFGSRNQRVLQTLWKVVHKINALESSIATLSDAELKGKTAYFREQLKAGAKLEAILPEAFAVVREASKRVMGMRHFDVQLIGAMVLNQGNIAEMRTGEGKTLMSTLASYLNALPGLGVHIVTVNDYLAKRDAEWMRPLFESLGLTVGVNLHGMTSEEKQAAYLADITYGTNNEYGFDYLRDNMVFRAENKVQRGHYFAIVDEVDSILIDEARTPLIISGTADESIDLYIAINDIIPQLKKQADKEAPGDYFLDEKSKQAYLSEDGHQQVEELLMRAGLLSEGESLYDSHNIVLMHHIYAALRAHTLFHRDVDYIVQKGEVVIVDEHTGRTMPGRRWSDGLHQAVEAKEKVKINQENQTLASITFQNYFRIYEKLSGMTGTADTEAYEFQQIYDLEVNVIPTHKPMIRDDQPDLVYMSLEEKHDAIVADIQKVHATQQPILVGTASIEASELLSRLLVKAGIKHQVLNAKFHEKEAEIVAEAGRPGAVTIATNMAGRGTDIVLGGNLDAELKQLENATDADIAARKVAWQARHDLVLKVGGLYVLGTERHESRRIDNQLRGRSGRQGDPGRSRFYLSLGDNLLRIFGGERLNAIMKRIGMEKGAVLESRMLSRSIENAQRKVEAYNFDVRKQLLEFDDVANEQRKVIYRQRDELLSVQDISETITEMGHAVIRNVIAAHIPPNSMEEVWDVPGLEQALKTHFHLSLPLQQWLEADRALDEEQLHIRIEKAFDEAYQQKIQLVQSEVIREFEKSVMLGTLDKCWREHLAAMDYLRQGIHLRGYAQKNPKQEYKREAFQLFSQLLDKVNFEVMTTLSQFEVKPSESVETMKETNRFMPGVTHVDYQHAPATLAIAGDNALDIENEAIQTVTRFAESPRVGRNDACPCGSGKKYKACHGRLV